LPLESEAGSALALYRLLAAGLAARVARGTHAHLPGDRLVRDLYLIREAAAVDGELAAELPGLLPVLQRARSAAVRIRPELTALSPQEAAVEHELRAVLSADPREHRASASPEGSLDWAESRAARIRSSGGA